MHEKWKDHACHPKTYVVLGAKVGGTRLVNESSGALDVRRRAAFLGVPADHTRSGHASVRPGRRSAVFKSRATLLVRARCGLAFRSTTLDGVRVLTVVDAAPDLRP